jgi:formiminotetrahydrofolate cyclodeaminase
MVARVTRNNVSFAAKASEADFVIGEADRLRAELLSARGEDEAAYGRVVAALALPKASEAERAERARELQEALAGAAAAPLHVASLAVAVLELGAAAAALGNAQLASDVVCAGAFARAALTASAANVRINHAYLRDPELIRSQENQLAALERAAIELAALNEP